MRATSFARLGHAKRAHDELIAAAHRAQGDALKIESQAKYRLADEYDAAQERGEVAKASDSLKSGPVIPDENNGKVHIADLGLSHKDIHEAREIRDAERNDPGVVERTAQAIPAELVRDDTCIASGITACAAAPVLALCRRLIEAGFDPAAPLCVYRGNVLCLRVRSIGQGAGAIVVTAGNGCPIFAKAHSRKGFTASPVRSSGMAATTVPAAAFSSGAASAP